MIKNTCCCLATFFLPFFLFLLRVIPFLFLLLLLLSENNSSYRGDSALTGIKGFIALIFAQTHSLKITARSPTLRVLSDDFTKSGQSSFPNSLSVNKYQCIILFPFDLLLLNINYKQIEINCFFIIIFELS